MTKLYFKQEGNLVRLLLDSSDQKVNAVSAKVVLSSGSRINQVYDANSAINFWVEKPAVKTDTISFSGIIPGGFQGTAAPILGFSWHGRAETVEAVLTEVRVLLHDGLGTEAPVIVSPLVLQITNNEILVPDTVPPEEFSPIISQDENIFGGQKFLVFQTQDKQTGISHYEVSENWSKWQRIENPYLLENQKFNLSVLVKAVDLAGNERVVTVFSPVWSYLSYVAGAIIVLSLITWFFKRKKFYSSV